jgi:hypothetical protein
MADYYLRGIIHQNQTNMKRSFTFIAIAITLSMAALAFMPPGNSDQKFVDTYLTFKTSLDDLGDAQKNDGDIEAAVAKVRNNADDLAKYAERMETESASKWSTFESVEWPGHPRNWRCHLECVYREWKCLKLDGEDWLWCYTVYQNCARSC